jgi:phosphonoacetate hydrolase
MKPLPRFIWCIFDGLRRDMITPDIAPRLRSFIDAGSDFPASRCVFPSVTRVNAAAMACGATPGVTGVVANMLYDPKVFSDKLMQTGLHDHIAQAEQVYDGRFVTAPSLGDMLAGHGLKVAVVSSGSAGATHLLNPRAAQLGHVRLSLSDWRTSTPADYAAEILRRFGPIPPAATPNAARIQLQTDMILDAVLPEIAPDVLIVWFSDPDSTYHYCGIGAPESIAAIRNADAQFGRLLDHRAQAADSDNCQVIVCSDHGLITAREKIEVKQHMRDAGIRIGNAFADGNIIAGNTGYCGALRVAAGNEAAMRDMVNWLLEQPWCGPVFTPHGNGVLGGIPGTLDRALLALTHPRTPEVYYVLAANSTPDRWGRPGSCYFSGEAIPVGGATHGGLHPIEMNNLLAMGGPAFKQGYASPWPASHTDIVPTLLKAFGIPTPGSVTGRALTEADATAAIEPAPPQSVTFSSESSARRQHLKLRHVGNTCYIDHGWAEQA